MSIALRVICHPLVFDIIALRAAYMTGRAFHLQNAVVSCKIKGGLHYALVHPNSPTNTANCFCFETEAVDNGTDRFGRQSRMFAAAYHLLICLRSDSAH